MAALIPREFSSRKLMTCSFKESENSGVSSQNKRKSSLQATQLQQQQMWQQYYQQMYAQQYQQWIAMCQKRHSQQMQAAYSPSAQAQLQMQRMQSYPYYGAMQHPAAVAQSQPQAAPQLARVQSAPAPVAQPAAPVQPAQAQPAPQPAAIPQNPPAPEAAPRRRFAEMIRPGIAFRLFMFYYLFCSPTLPEWQRTAFVGALVMFYMYSVNLMGYLFPNWRNRNANQQDQDLDIIAPGPNDDENAPQNDAVEPLTRRELVERFVVGLVASLLPTWNPARVN